MSNNHHHVFYHGGCLDGILAAYIARFHLGVRTNLYAWHTGGQIDCSEILHGHHVYFVDCSPSRNQAEIFIQAGQNLVVLDHHKTAFENLQGLEGLQGKLDIDHSGAMLAWQWFNGPDAPVPNIVQYVQDRDLWRFKLPNSREINAALAAIILATPIPQEQFKEVTDLMANWHEGGLTEMGHILLMRDKQIMDSIMTQSCYGKRCGVVNGIAHYRSELGSRLLERDPTMEVGAVYWALADGNVRVSLRSRGSEGAAAFDCAAFCERYSGGGHHHAAGVTLAAEDVDTFLHELDGGEEPAVTPAAL